MTWPGRLWMTCTACSGPSSSTHPIPSHPIASHLIAYLLAITHIISPDKAQVYFVIRLCFCGHTSAAAAAEQAEREPRRGGGSSMGQQYWNDGAAIQRIQHILRQIIESGQWSERPQSWDGTDERDRRSDPSMWVFKNRDSTEDNPRDITSILGPTLIRVILQPALSTFNWICLTHVNAAATPPESTRLVISEDSYWYLLISACPWAHAQYSHSHRTADPPSCRPPHAHQSGLVALISRSSTDIL